MMQHLIDFDNRVLKFLKFLSFSTFTGQKKKIYLRKPWQPTYSRKNWTKTSKSRKDMNTKTRRNHTRIDAISTEKATHFKDVCIWKVGIKDLRIDASAI